MLQLYKNIKSRRIELNMTQSDLASKMGYADKSMIAKIEEEIPEELARTGEFFGLRISGDSMEPDIHNGDTVIVKRQDDAESDEIVIALVNGNDGVCKRLKKYADSIALISLNPNYEPMYFNQEEIEEKPVKIIGKVVELRRKF